MLDEDALKILKAYRNGVRVMISSQYVDDFARIWLDGNKVMISSQVWADQELTKCNFRLSFYKQLDTSEMEAHANPA